MNFASAAGGILDPQSLIHSAGPWGLLVVCAIIFAETGLLIGFVLPGDTLLFFTGLLTLTGAIPLPLWIVVLSVILAAVAGDQLGYLIGHTGGPAVFEKKESGLFSRSSVRKTHEFYDRFGPIAVSLARFVPVIRTFSPVAAGVAGMRYRTFVIFDVIGAIAWPVVLIGVGFYAGRIPGVADFVSRYIDFVLLGIVLVSVVPVVIRVIIARRRARSRPAAEGS